MIIHYFLGPHYSLFIIFLAHYSLFIIKKAIIHLSLYPIQTLLFWQLTGRSISQTICRIKPNLVEFGIKAT